MLERIFSGKSPKSAIPDGARVYAIGDIHGRLDLLGAMIGKIDLEETDCTKTLVFLGDYIDRGPQSRGVISALIEIAGEFDAHFLKGNHEAAMLDFLEDPENNEEWLSWGGAETLESYAIEGVWRKSAGVLAAELRDALPASHLSFLEGLKPYLRIGDYVFVHAGLKPGVALEDQGESDLFWIRSEFHNTAPTDRPEETVVHGHHPLKKPLDAGWRIAVDTGAVWSGQLTAVVLENSDRRFLTCEMD